MPDLSNQKCAMTGVTRAELSGSAAFPDARTAFHMHAAQEGKALRPAQSAPGDADNRKNAYCARAA